MLNKVLDEYTSESWSKAVGDAKLAEYVRKYQDPKQADTIMKVQQELDETKIVLVSRESRELWVGAGAGEKWEEAFVVCWVESLRWGDGMVRGEQVVGQG